MQSLTTSSTFLLLFQQTTSWTHFECTWSTFLTVQRIVNTYKTSRVMHTISLPYVHFREVLLVSRFGCESGHSIPLICQTQHTTLATCLACGRRKKEVLAVKKVKSSLSSSKLQYPLLMLLLPVICGVGSSLRDSVSTLRWASGDQVHHSRLQWWEGTDGPGDHKFRWRASAPRATGRCRWNVKLSRSEERARAGISTSVPVSTGHKRRQRSRFSRCSWQLSALHQRSTEWEN